MAAGLYTPARPLAKLCRVGASITASCSGSVTTGIGCRVRREIYYSSSEVRGSHPEPTDAK